MNKCTGLVSISQWKQENSIDERDCAVDHADKIMSFNDERTSLPVMSVISVRRFLRQERLIVTRRTLQVGRFVRASVFVEKCLFKTDHHEKIQGHD